MKLNTSFLHMKNRLTKKQERNEKRYRIKLKMNTQHTPNLWDIVKTVLRGKFITLCDYLKNWRDVIQNKNKIKLNSITESSRTKRRKHTFKE